MHKDYYVYKLLIPLAYPKLNNVGSLQPSILNSSLSQSTHDHNKIIRDATIRVIAILSTTFECIAMHYMIKEHCVFKVC